MTRRNSLSLLLTAALLLPCPSWAQSKRKTAKNTFDITEYGAVDSRTEYSTAAIQKAINEASAAGGGRVYVPAGCYLISPIRIETGVELYLDEGALLLGTTDRSKYNIPEERNINLAGERGLIWSAGARNISIRGKGTIDGQGEGVATHTGRLIAEGLIKDWNAEGIKKRWESDGNFRAEWPRPQEENRPMLIALYDSDGVVVEGVRIENSGSWTTTFWRCSDLLVENVTVNSVNFWNNDGINLMDCTDARVRNCNINSADDGICLKSHDYDAICENIVIENCTIRSSASAIKFGTASKGGYRNVTVKNIKVKDTYRSAIALEAVDGGVMENIRIKGIDAVNTWNAIFVIAGTRDTSHGHSTVSNITIEDVTCRVPATQPDTGYPFAVRHRSNRNLCPSLITGSPLSRIENITVKNLKITFAGGGMTDIAHTTVDDLAVVMDDKYRRYPEYDMFGEMPAWGLVCRNINGLRLENIEFRLEAQDYRNPVVIDNTDGVVIKKLSVDGENKTPVVLTNSVVRSISSIASPDNTSGKTYLQ